MTVPAHVMVAILRDGAGRVLIAQRPPGKPQSGRWEFPGGKLEPGEAAEAGLRRELLEELGIVAGPMRRLIEIRHAYATFLVRLDVREVAHFGGAARGREGQALKWVFPAALALEDILEADRAIVRALCLPDFCLVTPDAGAFSRESFIEGLQRSLHAGIRLVQLRARSLPRPDFVALAREVLPLCREHDAQLLLNGDPGLLGEVDADGIHLGTRALAVLGKRPLPRSRLLSVACHSLSQLRRAQAIDADMVLISPVAATTSHPAVEPIGWAGFSVLARQANMPAYALGGLAPRDLEKARAAGGRGIAAIRGLWREA